MSNEIVPATQECESPARKALQRITRIPVKPFPDPGAHSWIAFAEAVHTAYQRIQQQAHAALSVPCPCTQLRQERDDALRVRDLAREASQRDLEAKREAEAECDSLRAELAKAQAGFRDAATQAERSRQFTIAAQNKTQLVGAELEKQSDRADAAVAERDTALSLLDQAREAITEYRRWFDTCSRTIALGWVDKSTAASRSLDAVLDKIDAARKPEVKP